MTARSPPPLQGILRTAVSCARHARQSGRLGLLIRKSIRPWPSLPTQNRPQGLARMEPVYTKPFKGVTRVLLPCRLTASEELLLPLEGNAIHGRAGDRNVSQALCELSVATVVSIDRCCRQQLDLVRNA